MTMTRQTKAKHTAQLITAATTGYCTAEFVSPKLSMAARADRGHTRMTATEYATHRMNRGQAHTCRIDLRIEMRAQLRRQQRIIGGRRITGLTPGTKIPVARRREQVERSYTVR